MKHILTCEQMRSIDERFIQELRIPSLVLMEHAAGAVANLIIKRGYKSVYIFTGPGNNGADGLSLLRQLHMRDVHAKAMVFSISKDNADFMAQYNMAVNCGLPIQIIEDGAANIDLSKADVLVDALFGTGLSRELTGKYARAVELINGSCLPVIAVDIPSGVCTDTGEILGEAVKACVSVTFQYAKRGHMLLPGRELTGELICAPIAPYCLDLGETTELYEYEDIKRLLPARPMNSYKGLNGSALLFAGSKNYTGAALLAAKAALRAGTGLLHAATPKLCAYAFESCAGAICHPLGEFDTWEDSVQAEAEKLIGGVDVIGIGPGMGRESGVCSVLRAALISEKPIVIDADALNALSFNRDMLKLLHENAILTPHIGEMKRLTGESAIERPYETAERFAREWGCVVLLKGATSVISSGTGRSAINITGNAGLAKGGSGDMLTGIILGLLAQGIGAYSAACAGAYILGASADKAYELLGNRMLIPEDCLAQSFFETGVSEVRG